MLFCVSVREPGYLHIAVLLRNGKFGEFAKLGERNQARSGQAKKWVIQRSWEATR
jgi:hypothetical protein